MELIRIFGYVIMIAGLLLSILASAWFYPVIVLGVGILMFNPASTEGDYEP